MPNKKCVAIFLAFVIILEFIGIMHGIAIVGGEKEISQIVEQTDNVTDPKEKIEKILILIVDDYFQAYGANKIGFWIYEVYGDIPLDGTRPRLRSSLFTDPYWAAYYNTGACIELAAIFNETATQAGFKSRIVGTKNEDHAWNEVFLDSRWVHVDPTLYYHYYRNGDDFSECWFDTPEKYQGPDFWHHGYSQIIVYGTDEDISPNYLKMGNLSIITSDIVDKIEIRPNTSTQDIKIREKNSNYSISLGEKGYFVKAMRYSLNPIFIYEDSGYATIRDNETTVLYLDPMNKTLYWPGIIAILLFVLNGALIYIVFKKYERNQ